MNHAAQVAVARLRLDIGPAYDAAQSLYATLRDRRDARLLYRLTGDAQWREAYQEATRRAEGHLAGLVKSADALEPELRAQARRVEAAVTDLIAASPLPPPVPAPAPAGPAEQRAVARSRQAFAALETFIRQLERSRARVSARLGAIAAAETVVVLALGLLAIFVGAYIVDASRHLERDHEFETRRAERLARALAQADADRERTAALAALARATALALDPKEVAQTAIRHLEEHLNIKNVLVYAAAEGAHLQILAFDAPHPELFVQRWERIHWPTAELLVARAVRRGETVVAGRGDQGVPAASRQAMTALGVETLAAVPLYARGRLAGALVLLLPPEHVFTTAERELTEAMGRQVAVALENSRLLQEAEAEREKVRRAEAQREEFYREVVLAVTGGRLVLHERAELQPTCAENIAAVRDVRDIRAARVAVRERAIAMGLAPDRARDLELAVAEAAANAWKHAGGGSVCVCRTEEGVEAYVVDQGPGINPDDIARAAFEKGFSTAHTLGAGFTLMLSLTDRVHLVTDDHGTTVALEMRWQPLPQPEPWESWQAVNAP
ncbi:MAG: ATP-binding protein [Armatimonadetes bacterium]|nr:ATP-binding protein [Armatimonadota bacterium]